MGLPIHRFQCYNNNPLYDAPKQYQLNSLRQSLKQDIALGSKDKSKIMNIVSKIQNLIRNMRLASVRKRLKPNQQRTIFCNMCLGGILYHDYGLKFNSPFINLMIPAHEYVDLLSNAKHILGGGKKA